MLKKLGIKMDNDLCMDNKKKEINTSIRRLINVEWNGNRLRTHSEISQ